MRYLVILIALGTVSAAPTYTADIRPILERRCVKCHAPGEVAPMPLRSYQEVRPWAKSIKEEVELRRMPPWHAMPSHHAFRNDRSLSETEIKTIAEWVDRGSPEGETAPPIPVAAAASGWKLGTPDIVVEVPGFQVPARGVLPYNFLIVPLHLDHDVWVRAAEFRIDQRQVVHHMNAFVRPPGSSYLAGFPRETVFAPTVAQRAVKREGEGLFARRQLLLGYEPGYAPMDWLPDSAKLIPAGSDLILEIHYNPNGKAVVDHSHFGLYFAKGTPRHRILAIDTLRNLDLQIPPGDAAYRSTAAATFEEPVKLLALQPHMHLRGKSMRVTAVYPDQRDEVLLDVPKYDFNWQTTYVLARPLALPAGTKLVSVAYFDNSPNNRFNPDPSATVHWGDQTFNEMHIAFLELVLDVKADAEKLFAIEPPGIKPR